MICKSFLVSGRVQGVGFRHYVHHVAKKMGLKGWVRNVIDGDVEVLACGPDKDLATFMSFLQKGPPLSRVLDVKEKDISGMSMGEDFQVVETGVAQCW